MRNERFEYRRGDFEKFTVNRELMNTLASLKNQIIELLLIYNNLFGNSERYSTFTLLKAWCGTIPKNSFYYPIMTLLAKHQGEFERSR